MAIQQTTWKPNTCDCEIVYEWDDALPSEQVLATLIKVNRRGDEHANIIDASLISTLREEVHRFEVATELTIADGWDEDHFTATWDPGRTLTITIPDATKSNKVSLQAAIAVQVGLGLVLVK